MERSSPIRAGAFPDIRSLLIVFWLCIGGISNLADKMNDRNIANKADSFTKLIIGIYVAGIVLAIIGSFVKSGGFLDGFIDVAGSACSIVAYLSYLSLRSA